MKAKILYYTFEKSVVNNGAGGLSHIIGVLSSLSKHYEIQFTYVGNKSDRLLESSSQHGFKVISKLNYLSLLKEIVYSDTQIHIMRKNIVGLVLFPIIKISQILFGKKKVNVIELNAISGDFKVHNILQRFVLTAINYQILKYFNGVYCVNENIYKRVIQNVKLNHNDIFVCRNGGPEPIKLKPYKLNNHGDKVISLVFYGSNQNHYHLNLIIESIRRSNLNIELQLIGYGFESFSDSFVTKHGSMSPALFTKYMSNRTQQTYGLIPLNRLDENIDHDIEPIKFFDYIAANLPVIHSSYCLQNNSSYKEFTFEYNPILVQSINETFSKLWEVSDDEYFKMCERANDISTINTWDNNLKPLIDFIGR